MFGRLPPATLALILANVAAYVLELGGRGAIIGHFALFPLGSPYFAPYQLVTYAFLHDPSSFAHIFFNMFALFMFGPPLELLWGARRFTAFYFMCSLSAGLTQLAVASLMGWQDYTVGASGAIFGLLLAFAWFFPRQQVAIYGILPMPAWLFVTLYGALELVLGVTNTQAGVAHFAHLGGMLGGALLLFFWRAQGSIRRRF